MGYKVTYDCDWPGCYAYTGAERAKYSFAPRGWQAIMLASNYGIGLEAQSAKKKYLCPKHKFEGLNELVNEKS